MTFFVTNYIYVKFQNKKLIFTLKGGGGFSKEKPKRIYIGKEAKYLKEA